jgi:hypothetical protein
VSDETYRVLYQCDNCGCAHQRDFKPKERATTVVGAICRHCQVDGPHHKIIQLANGWVRA